MKPVAYVSLPIAEFREKVLEFGKDNDGLGNWIRLFSKTLSLNGKNEPKDDFALALLEQVDTFRKGKAEKMRQLREKRLKESIEKDVVVEKVVVDPEVIITDNKKKVEKGTYGEHNNVKLTDDEMDKIIERVGNEGFVKVVSILSNYKASNGKKYKSDYAAINNWVYAKYEENCKKGLSNLSQANRLLLQMGGVVK